MRIWISALQSSNWKDAGSRTLELQIEDDDLILHVKNHLPE